MSNLLTKRLDAFKRLPKVTLTGEQGFRDMCCHMISTGFRAYTHPFEERYQEGQVTRFYGRTDIALAPVDVSRVIVSDDYIVALSADRSMLVLYWHKARKDKYCEISHSPNAEFMNRMFDYYRVCCGRIHEDIVYDTDDKAS